MKQLVDDFYKVHSAVYMHAHYFFDLSLHAPTCCLATAHVNRLHGGSWFQHVDPVYMRHMSNINVDIVYIASPAWAL